MLIVNRSSRTTPRAFRPTGLADVLESMWTDALRPTSPAGPAMNVWEDDATYFIESELPGMKMNDLEVTVHDAEVTIKGTRTVSEPSGGKFLLQERSGGMFSRTWTLPLAIDADKVQATLKDGVLLVTLPKSPKVLPRRVEVKPSAN